ncbi:lipoyl synthase [Helicovermis profundi]|uniref:Lipoyl synthase n=1 Tax=Helicovermis profundi TaxID=3065157 RepID=A0AAU9E773_9FIRM|nr:lipoyl synthase [Clostridia bacterium S502]
MKEYQRKPEWLKVQIKDTKKLVQVNEILKANNLNTVCEGAACPNRLECFSKRTATFMILGNNCTRGCKFCNISGGKPETVDMEEPKRLAKAVKEMGLKHAVITSVTRDDLDDGGSMHFYNTVKAIQNTSKDTIIEVLIPDFQGCSESLDNVIKSSPDIINHNVETIERLYSSVRPEADYEQSLHLLSEVKDRSNIYTKTGFMLGLGEKKEEVYKLIDDLSGRNIDFLTIGQYLPPSKDHFPLDRYVSPEEFDDYKEYALKKGFKFVASAPLVRSSYNASEFFEAVVNRKSN